MTAREELDQARARVGLDALPELDDREVALRTLRALGIDVERPHRFNSCEPIAALDDATLLQRAIFTTRLPRD